MHYAVHAGVSQAGVAPRDDAHHRACRTIARPDSVPRQSPARSRFVPIHRERGFAAPSPTTSGSWSPSASSPRSPTHGSTSAARGQRGIRRATPQRRPSTPTSTSSATGASKPAVGRRSDATATASSAPRTSSAASCCRSAKPRAWRATDSNAPTGAPTATRPRHVGSATPCATATPHHAGRSRETWPPAVTRRLTPPTASTPRPAAHRP